MSYSVQYAGFWMRFVAVIIDGIILQILQGLIIIPILGVIGLSSLTGEAIDPGMFNEDDVMEALPAMLSAMGSMIFISGLVSILY